MAGLLTHGGGRVLGLRWGVLAALLRKEAREVLRDRRTLLLTLVMPAVIYPLLIAALGELTAAATLSMRARPITVAMGPKVPADVTTAVSRTERLHVRPVDDPEALVRARKVRVGLTLGPRKTPDADPAIRLHFDAADDESRHAADRLEEVLEKVREQRLQHRVELLGVTPAYLKPLPVIRQNTSSEERMGSYGASRLLPFLLIVLSLVGASATAVDTTAGERERGTLLTLMSAPVRAGEVAAAKLLIVAAVALCAGLANILSLGTSLAASLGSLPEMRLSFSPRLIFGCVLALIPTTLYGAALLLGLAALGKTTKEAQAAQAPALFICLALAAVAVAPGVRSQPMLNALPVTGPALLMRDLLMQEASLTQVLTVVCASAVTLWLVVSFAARILTSEPMLSAHLSTVAVIRDLSGQDRATPLTASMLAAGVMLVTVFAGPLLQGRDLALGLIGTQVLLFVVPATLLRALRLPVYRVMGLSVPPPPRALLSAALFGLTVFVPILIAEQWLVEASGMKEMVEEMQRLMDSLLSVDLSPVQAVILFGVLPGLFEEMAFRGALLGVLLQVARPRVAVVLQAVLFALAHQSLVRFPPTFVLGLLMGLLRWRSGSVWPGALMHALNNGMAVMLMISFQGAGDDVAEPGVPLLIAVASALVVAGVLLWKQRLPTEGQHDRAG